MAELAYDCPNCSGTVSVTESLAGHDVVCPHCTQEFHATPPEQPVEALPEKVPFFKFSRRKLLKGELDRLTADGEYSEADHEALIKAASRLGLKDDEIDKLRLKELEESVKPLKARIYETAYFTDEDMAFLRALSRKLHITIEQEPALQMCREIYLMEVKGENPLVPSEPTELMLDRGEVLYVSTPSGWGQLRSKTSGYSGMSVSLPTGIRGVRFRLGQLTPLRTEELTLLAQGVLHVTSKRLVFNGDRRNTTVPFGRIIGTSLFRDAVEIEKSTGRSDYFFMDALHVRYVSAVVQFLKSTTS
jgi:hypothetical protein